MATVIRHMHGYILYFVLLFVVVSLFSIAGVFTQNEVIVDQKFASSLTGSINETAPAPTISPLKWGNFFKDIFSFFFWNISIYDDSELMNWLWLIRILFVFLPLIGLLITIWYSVPTVSG